MSPRMITIFLYHFPFLFLNFSKIIPALKSHIKIFKPPNTAKILTNWLGSIMVLIIVLDIVDSIYFTLFLKLLIPNDIKL